MKKVLVLDDDTDILAAVEIILSRENLDVHAIERWEKLPHELIEFDPDLILLDVMLTGADGRDICEYLNTLNESKNIPVILFSANHDLADELHNCKPSAFITKPFDAAQMIATIKSHLNIQ